MTTTTPPTDDDPRGPQVGDDEQLYRCIAYTNCLSTRVHELAKERNLKSQELLDRIQKWGLDVRLSALASLDPSMVDRIKALMDHPTAGNQVESSSPGLGPWNEEEQRITSAAFKFPCFSVDVASLAGSPESTLSRFLPGTGLVVISCRAAKELGCDVRLEPDPHCPENQAHAHVYVPVEKRKTIARKLVEASTMVRKPGFGESSFPA
jgi:hypothetical protein